MDRIFKLIKKEEERQQNTLMMIPSENYTYPEVRKAVGSVLMHKYAEGQPKKRYYKGNKITFTSKIFDIDFYHVNPETKIFDYDQIESQAKKFKPNLLISGGTAYPREINHKRVGEITRMVGAKYLADIAHEAGLVAAGVNMSPFPYADAVTMTTHKTLRGPRGALAFVRKEFGEALDAAIFPGLQGGPHLHTIAGIAVALEKTKTKEFRANALQTIKNAQRLAKDLQKLGFDVVSGGTDKHLVLVDLRNKNINGWFAAWALEVAGLIVNRNTVPYDTGSPYYPSGLRLGTPAITARGMGVKEMDLVSDWINSVINHIGERAIPGVKEERDIQLKKFKKEIFGDNFLKTIAGEVKTLCKKFPVP